MLKQVYVVVVEATNGIPVNVCFESIDDAKLYAKDMATAPAFSPSFLTVIELPLTIYKRF